MNREQKLNFVKQQNFMALKHAFDIIELFAWEVINPDQMAQYAELKTQIMAAYQPNDTSYLNITYEDDLKCKKRSAFEIEIMEQQGYDYYRQTSDE